MLHLSQLLLRSKFLRGFCAVWVSAGLCSTASGQEAASILAALDEAIPKIIEQAEPSVVSIARTRKKPSRIGDRTGELLPPEVANEPAFAPSEFGAGVVFSPLDQPDKKLILTMYHVVEGGRVAGQNRTAGDELTIRTHGRHEAGVEIVAADPRSDLAVLQIREGEELDAEHLKPVPFAKSSDYRKGQFVITLGNPYAIARDGSACAGLGMISNIARRPQSLGEELTHLEKIKQETLHHLGTLLQIDGQLNLGTSGGAVLNRRGELIGIITAMAALEGYEKSVGYAVPINPGIKRVIGELAHGYEVNYGLLGIAPVTKPFPAGNQPSAVWVEATWENAPASEAGVRREDMIYAVNGVPIYNREDLMREVALVGPGEKASLKIYRPRTRQWMTKHVTLTKWPVHNEDDIIATRHRFSWNQIAVDYATARYEFFGQEYRDAVLITHVEEDASRQAGKLRVGDFITHVNNQRVRSPQNFLAAVRGKNSGSVKLRLLNRRTVEVELSE